MLPVSMLRWVIVSQSVVTYDASQLHAGDGDIRRSCTLARQLTETSVAIHGTELTFRLRNSSSNRIKVIG